MHKTARQNYVLDIISEQGQASITELAEKLQVSADTIRRDLTELEKQPNSVLVNRWRNAFLPVQRYFWTRAAR